MTDVERYKQLIAMQVSEPFAASYKISDANLNFVMKKFEEALELRKKNKLLEKKNKDLQEQMERVQALFGTDTFA